MVTVLVAALTLDGCITRHQEEGTSFVSSEDQEALREALASCDASLMGATTFRAFAQPILQAQVRRRRFIVTRDPAVFADLRPAQPLSFTATAPTSLVPQLAAEGVQRLALLGGETVYNQCLAADLVDELLLTLEPRLVGQGKRFLTTAVDYRFDRVGFRALGPHTVQLHYRRRR